MWLRMVTDTSGWDRLQLDLFGAIENIAKDITNVVYVESVKAYEERRRTTKRSTGALLGSFEQKLLKSGTSYIASGIVFVGGPKAPYAPIVDQIGWKTSTGRKEGYNFMLTGAQKGGEVAGDIVIKHLSKL